MFKRLPTSSLLPASLSDAVRTHKGWLYVATVAVLLLVAFGTRAWLLGGDDLTFDEVATYYVAHRPLPDVIRYVMGAAREHPPAYYLVMSLWMQLAGTTEFAIRFPSALIGVLAVSWSFRLGRRLSSRYGGWWSALLCAVSPFGVWAGRTGRMYALVLLLSLMVMESWLRWVARPDRQHWLVFVVLSGVAAMTHYYLALLWPVQALVLLLAPTRTRAIRVPWVLTLAVTGLFAGGFVIVSPGIRAMLLEVAQRFPYKGFRGADLGIVFTDLYVWGFRPELLWAGVAGLGLSFVGWACCARDDRMLGVVFAAWGLVPLAIAHAVPEKLETRYLTPIFPALMLGLAVLLAKLRFSVLRLVAAGGVVAVAVWRLPLFYGNPDTLFSTRMETLHVAAQSGDALLMNGPWPALLLEYYHPPDSLTVYAVPAVAPPGFDEAVDVPRLEQIFADHDRVWVSYGAIHWADPQYSVSRWLAEHTYRVYQRAGMALYVRPAAMQAVRADVDLGARMRLREASVDRQTARVGDVLRVALAFEGHDLGRDIHVTLGLLDMHGDVWQEDTARLGPFHQLHDAVLPGLWREQRGFLLLPGLPPGSYTLGMQVAGDGVSTGDAATVSGWIPLGDVTIRPGMSGPDLTGLLPNYAGATATFGDALVLAGVQPHAANVMQGYPTGFYVWWHVTAPVAARELAVRLAGPETWDAGTFALGPDFYPPDVWQPGDVIRQRAFFQLPDKLPGGDYRVQIRMADGPPDAAWRDIYTFEVETRTRHYAPPLVRTRKDVRFGDVLRLRGYRLDRTDVRPGESVALTVYWQAIDAPGKLYAVFNQLRGPDNVMLWQGDSWPQAGIYTTDHWDAGEVVAETYTLVIPEGTSPGTYALYTGVYDPATVVRLPAVTVQGERLADDAFVLLELNVLP